MSELKSITKNYIVFSLMNVLLTMAFCGIFIAQNNTETMLFG